MNALIDTGLKLLPYLIALGLIVWIARSPDRFADLIRVKIFGMKSWAERKLEDVPNETARAVKTAKAQRADIRELRNTIRNAKAALEIELERLRKDEIEPLEKGADAAGNDVELVTQAEKDLEPLRVQEKSLVKRIAGYEESLLAVDADLLKLDKDIAGYEVQADGMSADSLQAQVSQKVDGAKTDDSEDSPAAMMKRAQESLNRLQGQAKVAREDADVVRGEENRRAKLHRLAAGEAEEMTIEERVAARIAKNTSSK